MTDYRAYLLNPAGHIVSGTDLHQSTDDAALEHVRSILKPGQQAEVWQGTRRLGLLHAEPPPPDANSPAPQTSQAPGQFAA